MKIFSCTANKSVPRYMTITVKNDITLQFLWYFEIRKQHSNAVRLLRAYTVSNSFHWHSNV